MMIDSSKFNQLTLASLLPTPNRPPPRSSTMIHSSLRLPLPVSILPPSTRRLPLKRPVLQLLLHDPDVQGLFAGPHGLDVRDGGVLGAVEEDVDFFERFAAGFDPEEGDEEDYYDVPGCVDHVCVFLGAG